MSRAFDQLQKGSLIFSVASGLRDMGKWAWHSEDDSRYRREDRSSRRDGEGAGARRPRHM